MNEREKIIRLWFDMWLKQQDLGIDKIFTEDVVYTESWCPKYENLKTVKHWFNEWNTRGKVIIWDIKQFFHKENQTVVEWYFKNEMNTGSVEEFDGISLIEWTEDNKIKSLKEYGCNLNNYNPYHHCVFFFFCYVKTNFFYKIVFVCCLYICPKDNKTIETFQYECNKNIHPFQSVLQGCQTKSY